MTTWYKVEIVKKVTYAVEIKNDKLSDKEKLDEAAHLAANHEEPFEELICSVLTEDNICDALKEVDSVISL